MSVVSFHEVPSLVDESDDEEAMERNAFRIEEVVAGFIDEAPIRHGFIGTPTTLDRLLDDPLEFPDTLLIFRVSGKKKKTPMD
ncbi:hypothetical protein YC2023_044871 [Brassica napus]